MGEEPEWHPDLDAVADIKPVLAGTSAGVYLKRNTRCLAPLKINRSRSVKGRPDPMHLPTRTVTCAPPIQAPLSPHLPTDRVFLRTLEALPAGNGLLRLRCSSIPPRSQRV